ncbi:hypothetical protein Syun_017013 [Stephania yunnanensis]|uniref:Uncharacterized protein n=1 Tax=Stephania yunnanensis TaxID=152371 RepID=A0AAP0P5F6_9MAGN
MFRSELVVTSLESGVREVAELYGSEKSFVVEVQSVRRGSSLPGEAKLQGRRQELAQTTPNQPVDDEAVYYKVAGECLKGCVYGLGWLGRKKRIYVDADASTSQIISFENALSIQLCRHLTATSPTGLAGLPLVRDFLVHAHLFGSCAFLWPLSISRLDRVVLGRSVPRRWLSSSSIGVVERSRQ